MDNLFIIFILIFTFVVFMSLVRGSNKPEKKDTNGFLNQTMNNSSEETRRVMEEHNRLHNQAIDEHDRIINEVNNHHNDHHNHNHHNDHHNNNHHHNM